MITPDTVVVGVKPDDISEDAFVGVLEGARSPALDEARQAYRLLASRPVSIAFLLAIFHHESQYGHEGITPKYDTRNPGNCRSLRSSPMVGTVITTERGPFVKYASWTHGWQDLSLRLHDPSYVYVKENRRTIREIITRFAPASDGNSPEDYINAVVADMNRWVLNPAPPKDVIKIDLAAGHHNSSGGNRVEHEQVGRLTPVLAEVLRSCGADVRVITPDEGRGDYPGDLSAVANAVRPDADLFLEVHTEGTANSNVRGVFCIYPDWNDDIDVDVRDVLGPKIAAAVSQATGLPLRGNGTMSEKQTGVGGQGHRLGVFGATARHKATMTRLIVEYGSHSSPADMALWNTPDFVQKAAYGTAQAIAAFYPLNAPDAPVDPPHAPEEAIELNGFKIVQGFKGFYEELRDYQPSLPFRVLGYPLENEWSPREGVAYQRFERGVLKWSADEPAPYHIHLKLLSEELP